MTLADLTPETLADGGLTMVLGYAALQIAKGVLAVTKFLDRLGDKWDDEKAHRTADVKHWEAVEGANEIAIAQRAELAELLGAGSRAQA